MMNYEEIVNNIYKELEQLGEELAFKASRNTSLSESSELDFFRNQIYRFRDYCSQKANEILMAGRHHELMKSTNKELRIKRIIGLQDDFNSFKTRLNKFLEPWANNK